MTSKRIVSVGQSIKKSKLAEKPALNSAAGWTNNQPNHGPQATAAFYRRYERRRAMVSLSVRCL
jgi:hypothetical protein